MDSQNILLSTLNFGKPENLPFEEEVCRYPYSIKHWLRYISAKKDEKAPLEVVNLLYERALKELPGINNCFERSLVFMHKMPRIWIEYLKLLMHQHLITKTRRTFDRALQALPITQHNRIWPLYLEFVKSYHIPETAIRVYKRYLKLAPEDGEEFIDYLRGIGRLDDAALKLYDIVNDDNFISKEGKSKHQLWNDLCELISKNPDKVQSLNVENIIREGIKQYRDEQGKLWNAYAQYFTRSGLFERARDIYEEAISSVMTIKDFSLVFDAYSQSEENLIKAQMENQDLTDDEEVELELRLAKYEYLIERRPLLLNSVALKQNPHNVEEWHKKVKLLEENPLEVIRTYMNAVQTVDPKQAIGKVHSLWIEFQAVKASYARVNDLATVWCEYAEMELRSDNFEQTIIMKKPLFFTVDVHLCWWIYFFCWIDEEIKTWGFTRIYGDFIGSASLKIAKYCRPIGCDVINTIASATCSSDKSDFIQSKQSKNLAKTFYLLYAKLEEDYGLAKHSMSIYERATREVDSKSRFEMYNIYIKKAAEMFGVTYTRQIYEKAIENLSDNEAREMCLRFADLEQKLGEIDRARAIYAHCSQMSDPRTQPEFWDIWKLFETKHGNEDTLREMLRIKRSVQATFNTSVNFMAAQMMSTIKEKTPASSMEAMEMQIADSDVSQAVEETEKRAKVVPSKKDISFVRATTNTIIDENQAPDTIFNPDEIDIDDL
uniref:Suppressor of forked domain-containing protein n=1 Tax=Tetranychus urticae TaxID=32264 RepID=T1KW55_TETUR